MIRRTSSGRALYRMLRIITLIATDFPDPVVPATSRCGIFPRLATTGCPPMSFPSTSVSGEALSRYCDEEITECSSTISRS